MLSQGKSDFDHIEPFREEDFFAMALELETARSIGKKEELRPGKVRYTGETTLVRNKVGKPIRVVFEVIETTHESNGQLLLVPDIEVHTFWTSLPDEPEVVLGLYREHGTMEQFHSEIKTDLYLERLPSGKFATNNLVLHFGIFPTTFCEL